MFGYHLLADPFLNKGTAFTDEERDDFELHGLLPPRVATLDEQVSRRLQALRGFATDLERYAFLRELAGHQRDGVLRAADPQHRGAAADRLHADGRRRLPAFQPAVPQAARPVPELAAPQAHQADPRQSAVRPHRGDRRHRRRAHPRPRRPGRRRHGHPDRQARALHRLRRHPSRAPRCRSFSTSAPTTTSGWPIRSTSAGGTSGCAARSTTSSSRSSSPP